MYRRYIKCPLDILFAFLFLLLFAPVLLVLSVTGAIFMKGAPFFVQTRIGKNERPFRLIKFRTMTNGRDAKGRLLPDEIRTTPYGRFLRKSSLDELPELINILKGDMSFVGPRPLLPEYLESLIFRLGRAKTAMDGANIENARLTEALNGLENMKEEASKWHR